MAQTLKGGIINAGRTRAREHLLAQNDRLLEDAGFSRELLELGNRAWPWRVDDGLTAATVFRPEHERLAVRERAVLDATRELSRLSDAELADLDIARSDIADAVRHGRPGHELDATTRQAA